MNENIYFTGKKLILITAVLVSVIFYGCASGKGSANKSEQIAVSNAGGDGSLEEHEEKDFAVLIKAGDKELQIAADMPMSEVLDKLGEPLEYYEAPSCAFRGMNKIYTYMDYVINTYPVEDKDYISLITLYTDMVGTGEGIRLGDTKEDVTAVYGKADEIKGSESVYYGKSSRLGIVIENNIVKAITIYSSKADN